METDQWSSKKRVTFHERRKKKHTYTTRQERFLLFSTFNVAQPRSMRRLLRHGYDLRRVTEEVVSQIVSHWFWGQEARTVAASLPTRDVPAKALWFPARLFMRGPAVSAPSASRSGRWLGSLGPRTTLLSSAPSPAHCQPASLSAARLFLFSRDAAISIPARVLCASPIFRTNLASVENHWIFPLSRSSTTLG